MIETSLLYRCSISTGPNYISPKLTDCDSSLDKIKLRFAFNAAAAAYFLTQEKVKQLNISKL